jgi:hypothetical protein
MLATIRCSMLNRQQNFLYLDKITVEPCRDRGRCVSSIVDVKPYELETIAQKRDQLEQGHEGYGP